MTVLDLRTIARALGGDVVGAQVLCPGPGHSAKDRSLSVRFSMLAPDGFVVFSHAGDDPLVCKDHVRGLLGLSRRHFGAGSRPPRVEPKPREPDPDRTASALALWTGPREP